MWGEKFIGDVDTNEVHDLDNEKSLCQIEQIINAKHDVPLNSLSSAQKMGFDNCNYCIGINGQ